MSFYPSVDIQTPLINNNVVTGRVTNVQTQSTFQSALGKFFSLVFDGAPWQLGQQAHQTTIFVEPLSSFAGEGQAVQRSIIFLGDIRGAVCEGNIVQARVRKKRGMLIVSQMNNLTTNSPVVAATQFSQTGLLVLLFALLVIAITFITAVANCVLNGSLAHGFMNLLAGVIEGLSPLIITAIVGAAIIGSLRK